MNKLVWKHAYDGSNSKTVPLKCPYCDQSIGAILRDSLRYVSAPPYVEIQVLECPLCGRPIIKNSHNTTIPPSLPFESVKHTPPQIEKLYEENRKVFASSSFVASTMLSRTLIMHIAVNKGAEENKNFAYYVNYILNESYMPPSAKAWVDKIRTLGNDSVHKLEERTKEEAELSLKFLMYLLKYIYELPNEIKSESQK